MRTNTVIAKISTSPVIAKISTDSPNSAPVAAATATTARRQ